MKELFEEIIEWIKESQTTITSNTFSKWFEATQELYNVEMKYMPSVNRKIGLDTNATHRLLLMNYNNTVGIIILDYQYNFLKAAYDINGINMTKYLTNLGGNYETSFTLSIKGCNTPEDMINYLQAAADKKEEEEAELERKRLKKINAAITKENKLKIKEQKRKEREELFKSIVEKGYNPDINLHMAMGKYKAIAVDKYDKNGNFIESFDDYHFAGVDQPGLIMRCCKGKVNSAYGFIWKYKNNK